MENNIDENNTINIGVLTSGGDAPGMNGVIRAVTRGGIHYGYRVFGIRRGFHGLWRGDIEELSSRSVSEVLHRGGTFLMTARSKTFMTDEGVEKAAEMCRVFNLSAVIACGGDGTYRGALALSRQGIKVIAVPGTIDNDIGCTEYTIGYDTALNTAVEAIDKLRDTASSHERCSVVEVMGRHAGFIALNVAIATGAEITLLPEKPFVFEQDVVRKVLDGRNKGKRHFIVVVAEGVGSAVEIAKKIEEVTEIETRATTLGYLQRGGNPTWRDRYMATNMGIKAIECLQEGKSNRAICLQNGRIVDVDLAEALQQAKTLEPHVIQRHLILAQT